MKVPLISIVDDDEANRKATKALIRSLGYTVATFASAEEYLASDRVKDSSCLITDLQMPGMGGADLVDLLIANGHHAPIIVITALSGEKIRTRVLEAGALGFFRKPFDDDCLIRCLEKVLKRPGPAEQ